VISSIVHIAREYDNDSEPWPIQIEDHDGRLHSLDLLPGQVSQRYEFTYCITFFFRCFFMSLRVVCMGECKLLKESITQLYSCTICLLIEAFGLIRLRFEDSNRLYNSYKLEGSDCTCSPALEERYYRRLRVSMGWSSELNDSTYE